MFDVKRQLDMSEKGGEHHAIEAVNLEDECKRVKTNANEWVVNKCKRFGKRML